MRRCRLVRSLTLSTLLESCSVVLVLLVVCVCGDMVVCVCRDMVALDHKLLRLLLDRAALAVEPRKVLWEGPGGAGVVLNLWGHRTGRHSRLVAAHRLATLRQPFHREVALHDQPRCF